jgi:5-methylcytosine-specific restriction endonuclease McrA
MAIRKGQQGKYKSCDLCNSLFLIKQYSQRFCSEKCGYTFQNKKQKQLRDSRKRLIDSCLRCESSLVNKKRNAIYCSKTCKSMDHTAKHRAKSRTLSTARRVQIYQRDHKKCYICDIPLLINQIELDHIIPVVLGGSSDPSNIACSCRSCNRSKGTKVGLKQIAKLLELRQ